MQSVVPARYTPVMDDERLSIRVPKALRKTVERLAREEKRSLSNQVEYMLEGWCKDRAIPLEPAS